MIKSIPCGGFKYDDTEIKFENGIIRPMGGSGGELEKIKSEGGCGYTDENGVNIEWDGDTEGRVFAYGHTDDFDLRFAKVSNLIPEQGELIGGKLEGSFVLNGEEESYNIDITEDEYLLVSDDGGYIILQNCIIAKRAGTFDVIDADITIEIPESGVYFIDAKFMSPEYENIHMSLTAPPTVHKIDKKFLPNEQIIILSEDIWTELGASGYYYTTTDEKLKEQIINCAQGTKTSIKDTDNMYCDVIRYGKSGDTYCIIAIQPTLQSTSGALMAWGITLSLQGDGVAIEYHEFQHPE